LRDAQSLKLLDGQNSGPLAAFDLLKAIKAWRSEPFFPFASGPFALIQ